MHAAGNARKQSQDAGTNARVQTRKSRVRANSETDVKKESDGVKAAGVEKHLSVKREVLPSKKPEKDSLKAKAGAQATKTALKKAAKDPHALPKAPPASKQNGKAKTVHFDSK